MVVLAESVGVVGALHGIVVAIGGVRAKGDFVEGGFLVRLDVARGQQGVAVAARDGETDGQAAFPRGPVGQRHMVGGRDKHQGSKILMHAVFPPEPVGVSPVGAGLRRRQNGAGKQNQGGKINFHERETAAQKKQLVRPQQWLTAMVPARFRWRILPCPRQ